MDEIYLDYDPRNAIGIPGITGARPYAGAPPLLRQPAPTRQVLAVKHPPAAQPVYYAPPQPVYYPPQPAYAPAYYPQQVAQPTRLGSKLSDLTVGDMVPLIAQLIVAFRPMPTPPADEGRIDTNLVNMTKFVDAIARHFHADQQLNAAGEVARTFLR